MRWAETIANVLDIYIPDPQIPLCHSDPFTLLIAVVLSAQCTDARVNQVTPALFEQAHTAQQMASLSVETIAKLIARCGLAKQKAQAIHRLSQELVQRTKGRVPKTRKALERLPGVGRKTASVVQAQAFGIPTFPVDTHIFRSAHRWGLSQGKTVRAVETDLKRLFPKTRWNRLHLQIVLFARQYCPARKHQIGDCLICRLRARISRQHGDNPSPPRTVRNRSVDRRRST
ncbi:MAG: endonuclease [Chlamydiota bacterium]